MSLSWSALFISLGWNFTEYGIVAMKGSGSGITWIICAVLFLVMGFVPLALIIRHFAKGLRERESYPDTIPWKGKVLLQLVVAGGGVCMGIRFFDLVA